LAIDAKHGDMVKRLVSYFLRGVVLLAPIGLTAWMLFGAVHAVDKWAGSVLGLPFPGVGLIITIGFVTFMGFLASNFLTKRLVGTFERLLDRLPVVKLLHGSLKDVFNAFVGDKRRFDRPVVVSLNSEGSVKALGFVTRNSVDQYLQPNHVAVYFPQAYNFAGQVVFVPQTAVQELPMSASDVMTFIVSGGISGK